MSEDLVIWDRNQNSHFRWKR